MSLSNDLCKFFLLWLTLINGHFDYFSDGFIIRTPMLLPKRRHHHHHHNQRQHPVHRGGGSRYPLFGDGGSTTGSQVLYTSTTPNKLATSSSPPPSLSSSLSSSRTEFIRRVDEYLEDISLGKKYLYENQKTWRESLYSEIRQDFDRDRRRFQWLLSPPSSSPSSSSPSNDGTSAMDMRQHRHQKIDTEWIYVLKRKDDDESRQLPLALRTVSPILDDKTIDLLRCVADEYWTEHESDPEISSLFTYQRKGNWEAHLGDLCSYNTTLKDAIQSTIQTCIFPIVRRHFLARSDHRLNHQNDDGHINKERCDEVHNHDISTIQDDNQWDLHIFDSLFIRYNATAAGVVDQVFNSEEGDELEKDVVNDSDDQRMIITKGKGAGQPLHRDLGVVSVNIMLNDATEFDGGGTFFEEQLSRYVGTDATNDGDGDGDDNEEEEDETRLPLKPGQKRGHALFHYSNRRHAGAGTTSGVRDILVMFLSSSRTNNHHSTATCDTVDFIHPIELGARIKEKSKAIVSEEADKLLSAQELSFVKNMKRTMLYREAINCVENDGEAYHYLGTCLDALSQSIADEEKQQVGQKLALESLQVASKLIPNDGRLFNNQGLTLGKQQPVVDDMHIERAFERSLDIHLRCKAVSCDVQTNLESTALNYGLFLSNRDRWEDAVEVLDFIDFFGPYEDAMLKKLRLDAYRLREFCAKQCTVSPDSTLSRDGFPSTAKAAYDKLKKWIGSPRSIF